MTAIDFTPIINSAMAVIATLILGAFAAWQSKHQKNAAEAATAQTALQNALGAMQQAVQKGLTAHPLQVNLPGISPALGAGIQYAIDQGGPAIGKLSLEEVADKLNARLGVKNIQTNLATAASPAPSPAPLAAVEPEPNALVPGPPSGPTFVRPR